MTDKKDIRSILGKRPEPAQGTLFDKEALGKINTNFDRGNTNCFNSNIGAKRSGN